MQTRDIGERQAGTWDQTFVGGERNKAFKGHGRPGGREDKRRAAASADWQRDLVVSLRVGNGISTRKHMA